MDICPNQVQPSDRPGGLEVMNGLLCRPAENGWNSSPESVQHAFQGASTNESPAMFVRDPSVPTTWFIKTRSGGMGILQITGFAENPHGVKLRYKLVQKAHTAAPAAASGPPRRALAGPPLTARTSEAEVELLALSPFPRSTNAAAGVSHDENDQPADRLWWRPDGSPAAKPAQRLSGSLNSPQRDVYDLLFRVGGQTDSTPDLILASIAGTGCHPAGISGVDQPTTEAPRTFRQTLSCDPGLPAASFRVGVAAGPWRDALAPMELESHSMAGSEGPLMLQVIKGERESSLVCQYQQKAGWQTRLVVANDAGEILPGKLGQSFGVGDSFSYSATFKSAAVKDAKLHLQRRPYRWVEFRYVSLKPGHHTHVEVEDEVRAPRTPATPTR
jgi:hypothetical protein